MLVQFSSVAQLCLTLCDPMDCSTPGFPVHDQLLELSQTHVHRVNHLILFIPFSFCLQSFPAAGSFPLSQFFASGGQNIRASASASVLPMSLTMLVINSKEYFHYHVAMASKHLFHTRSYYNNR